MSREADTRRIVYDDGITRAFSVITMVWGAVALLVGVIVATQLSHWQANMGTSWLSFGRLRPLHTNAAIFAFVGNMMFAGIYYSTQRLCKVRTASDLLTKIHFFGWQLIILAAAITIALGVLLGLFAAHAVADPLPPPPSVAPPVGPSHRPGPAARPFPSHHFAGQFPSQTASLPVVNEAAAGQ